MGKEALAPRSETGVKLSFKLSFSTYPSRFPSLSSTRSVTAQGLELHVTSVVAMVPETEPCRSTVPLRGKEGIFVLRVGKGCNEKFICYVRSNKSKLLYLSKPISWQSIHSEMHLAFGLRPKRMLYLYTRLIIISNSSRKSMSTTVL